MEPREFLNILSVANKLKDTTRHSFTKDGRHESVAEHSWKLTLMALLLKDEFSQIDIDKVIKMCIIHDLGEIFTGDIPSFNKDEQDENKEDDLLNKWIMTFPKNIKEDFLNLLEEMNDLITSEAKLYKALDKIEAVIQHNEAPLDTWIPLEYELNLTYGADKCAFSEYLMRLREEIQEDTLKKIHNK